MSSINTVKIMDKRQLRMAKVQLSIEPLQPQKQEMIRQYEQGAVQQVTPQVAYHRAQLSSNELRPTDLIALQRAVGNSRVQRILARRIDGANDQQVSELAEENPGIKMQTKLAVGAFNVIQQQVPEREEEKIQAKPPVASITPLVQFTASTAEDGEMQTTHTSTLDDFAARRDGRPLPSLVRAFMEPRFGADFSQKSIPWMQQTRGSDMNNQRISRMRNLGSMSWKDTFANTNGATQIRARTVAEWVHFLQNDADTNAGSVEINAFMATALERDRALSGVFMVNKFNISSLPTEQEKVDLMIAFLTVGSGIDLANRWYEGNDQARSHMATLMSEYNAKFAGKAIMQMSRGGGNRNREFTNADVGKVSAYASEAHSMQGQGIFPPNPVKPLIAAALGNAFGAAVQVLQAGNATMQEQFKQNAFTLLRNSAMTIRGALDSIEAEVARDATLETTAFSGTVSAMAAATGFGSVALQIVAWGLGGVASAYFPVLVTGNGRDGVRDLKDKFHEKINAADSVKRADGTEQRNLVTSDKQLIMTIFDTVLNY